MPDQARINFAKRLRSLRERRYETAKEFAELLGIEDQRYRKWEQGRAEPSFALLLRVCQLLGTTPDYLLLGLDKVILERKPPEPAKTTVLKPKRRDRP